MSEGLNLLLVRAADDAAYAAVPDPVPAIASAESTAGGGRAPLAPFAGRHPHAVDVSSVAHSVAAEAAEPPAADRKDKAEQQDAPVPADRGEMLGDSALRGHMREVRGVRGVRSSSEDAFADDPGWTRWKYWLRQTCLEAGIDKRGGSFHDRVAEALRRRYMHAGPKELDQELRYLHIMVEQTGPRGGPNYWQLLKNAFILLYARLSPEALESELKSLDGMEASARSHAPKTPAIAALEEHRVVEIQKLLGRPPPMPPAQDAACSIS